MKDDRENKPSSPSDLIKDLARKGPTESVAPTPIFTCPKCESGEWLLRRSGGRSWRVCCDCNNIFSGGPTISKVPAKTSLKQKEYKDPRKIYTPQEE